MFHSLHLQIISMRLQVIPDLGSNETCTCLHAFMQMLPNISINSKNWSQKWEPNQAPKQGDKKRGTCSPRRGLLLLMLTCLKIHIITRQAQENVRNKTKSHIIASAEALNNLGKPQGCPRDAQYRPKRNPKKDLERYSVSKL